MRVAGWWGGVCCHVRKVRAQRGPVGGPRGDVRRRVAGRHAQRREHLHQRPVHRAHRSGERRPKSRGPTEVGSFGRLVLFCRSPRKSSPSQLRPITSARTVCLARQQVPRPRAFHSATVIESYMVIYGGYDESDQVGESRRLHSPGSLGVPVQPAVPCGSHRAQMNLRLLEYLRPESSGWSILIIGYFQAGS